MALALRAGCLMMSCQAPIPSRTALMVSWTENSAGFLTPHGALPRASRWRPTSVVRSSPRWRAHRGTPRSRLRSLAVSRNWGFFWARQSKAHASAHLRRTRALDHLRRTRAHLRRTQDAFKGVSGFRVGGFRLGVE